jgi:hypothetical protein
MDVYKSMTRCRRDIEKVTRYCSFEKGQEQGWGFIVVKKQQRNEDIGVKQRI